MKREREREKERKNRRERIDLHFHCYFTLAGESGKTREEPNWRGEKILLSLFSPFFLLDRNWKQGRERERERKREKEREREELQKSTC